MPGGDQHSLALRLGAKGREVSLASSKLKALSGLHLELFPGRTAAALGFLRDGFKIKGGLENVSHCFVPIMIVQQVKAAPSASSPARLITANYSVMLCTQTDTHTHTNQLTWCHRKVICGSKPTHTQSSMKTSQASHQKCTNIRLMCLCEGEKRGRICRCERIYCSCRLSTSLSPNKSPALSSCFPCNLKALSSSPSWTKQQLT